MKSEEIHEIEPGFGSVGYRLEIGDGRTPEGNYVVDRRSPNSNDHNAAAIAQARVLSVIPGRNLFPWRHWTVRPLGDGTPLAIYPLRCPGIIGQIVISRTFLRSFLDLVPSFQLGFRTVLTHQRAVMGRSVAILTTPAI